MTRIGIVGLGFMGKMHLETYRVIGGGAKVVAISDIDPKRAAGDLSGGWGNIAGAEGANQIEAKGTTDWRELVAMSDVDLVDICVPTPQHPEIAIAALEAGKHVVCEKPLARTSADAQRIADAARKAKGFFMPAMCMRFWPQWAYLKSAVQEKRYGKVLGATFRRVSNTPAGWFRNGKDSGGALLDLHIHDTDFVNYVFGKPHAVFTRGYVEKTGNVDHVVTQYLYDHVPLVSAEGGWAMADGFGFQMKYTVNFDSGTTLDFDLARGKDQLQLFRAGKSETIDCGDSHGYAGELGYMLDCIKQNKRPTTVTADDAVSSIKIVEAEAKSLQSGQVTTV
ncbi:MAG: Gfo/Idh/MocA family protein [Tepidisphaeraceae bacterium]